MILKSWAQTIILKRALIVLLVSWAGVSSILLLKLKPSIVLIGIDSNGTRVITKNDDPLFQAEVVSFLRHFLNLYYSYEAHSFEAQVGEATGLMSDSLWKGLEIEVTTLQKKIVASDIQQLSTLESIVKEDDGTFSALLKVLVKDRLQQNTAHLKIKVKVKSIPRSEKDPWGMEVDSLEETIL